MVSIERGNSIMVSFVQPWKHFSAMRVTVFGMITFPDFALGQSKISVTS